MTKLKIIKTATAILSMTVDENKYKTWYIGNFAVCESFEWLLSTDNILYLATNLIESTTYEYKGREDADNAAESWACSFFERITVH